MKKKNNNRQTNKIKACKNGTLKNNGWTCGLTTKMALILVTTAQVKVAITI